MAKNAVKFNIVAYDKTAVAFKTVGSRIGKLTKKVAGYTGLLGGAAGIMAGSKLAGNTLEAADKIHKLNIRLGASAEALSQYRHVAAMSGVEFNTFVMGLQRMTRRVSEAASGTGEAQGALQELFLSAEELSYLKPEEQFEQIADALQQVVDPGEKVRLAAKLFDSEAVQLLQMISGGSKGLQQMREDAHNLGMTMSQDMVEKIAETNDSLAEIGERIQGFVDGLMYHLSPAILEVADDIGAWMDVNREWLNMKIGKAVENLRITWDHLKPVIKAVWELFKLLGKAIGFVAIQLDKLSESPLKYMPMLQPIAALKGLTGTNFGYGAPGAEIGEQVTRYSEAAGIAAAGGGESSSGSWGGGAAVVNNFNTQITRDDAVAISTETERTENRL